MSFFSKSVYFRGKSKIHREPRQNKSVRILESHWWAPITFYNDIGGQVNSFQNQNYVKSIQSDEKTTASKATKERLRSSNAAALALWSRVVLDSWVVSQIWLDSDSNESSLSCVDRENQEYESSQSRITLIVIWVRVESTCYCLSQRWVADLSEEKTSGFCIYL